MSPCRRPGPERPRRRPILHPGDLKALALALGLLALLCACVAVTQLASALKGKTMRINPAALSKINWTNAVAFVVAVAAVFDVAIPEDAQKGVLEFVALATPLATMLLRSFFTVKK